MIAKLLTASLVGMGAICLLAQALPQLMPYLVVIFVMLVVGRVLWFYTGRW